MIGEAAVRGGSGDPGKMLTFIKKTRLLGGGLQGPEADIA